MAEASAGFEISLPQFAAALLAERETVPRARLTAKYISQLIPETAVVVYVIDDQESPEWKAQAILGDITLGNTHVEYGSGTLGLLAEKQEPLLFAAADLARQDYAHLDIRRNFNSLACIPMVAGEVLVGAVEIIRYEKALSESDLEPVIELAPFAALGLASAVAYESERNAQFASISRLTDLYDLGIVFNSTLEMDELIPIITSKIQQLLNVQAVNLWLVDAGEKLLLVNQSGVDPTVSTGTLLGPGEGLTAEIADSGVPLIAGLDDERLQQRNQAAAAPEGEEEDPQPAIFSLMAAPLFEREKEVGVLEAVNKVSGEAFDDDDLYLLTTACESAAGALHNASLLNAERKIQILETLVKVSTEITSTLDLDRVLQAVVSGPQAIIPYERAAIALERNGRLQLKAVSGIPEISAGDPDIKRLRQMLEWASALNQEILVSQREGSIDHEREETRARFAEYFEQSGMRCFYVLPLADDQGRVGMFSMESSDPDFLDAAHLEIVKVLAAQATVALRNAALYREVPFIGVLEPLLRKKARFLSMGKHRQRASVALAVAVLLFLIFFPLPMRLTGGASVLPMRTEQIGPGVEGIVRNVYVREGQRVQPGAVLADLEDWDFRSALAGAEAKYESAVADMNRALSANDGPEAGIHRIEAEYWASEVARSKERLQHTQLRTSIAGLVATPHIENFAGRHLNPGEPFASVVNILEASVDVAIDERDVALLKPGESAALKLDGFPTRTFKGMVAVVSPQGQADGDHRFFFARIDVPNDGLLLRAGMQGRGKVFVGWHPAGYVFFRRSAMWFWGKLWGWLG